MIEKSLYSCYILVPTSFRTVMIAFHFTGELILISDMTLLNL